MHSSGSITRMRSASWMQSTGQTSTHDLSLMSIQGSAMMYVTPFSSLARLPDQLVDDAADPLHERRLGQHLVEARRLPGAQARRVRVVREPDDGDVRVRVGDLLRVDAGDVGDHDLRRID